MILKYADTLQHSFIVSWSLQAKHTRMVEEPLSGTSNTIAKSSAIVFSLGFVLSQASSADTRGKSAHREHSTIYPMLESLRFDDSNVNDNATNQ